MTISTNCAYNNQTHCNIKNLYCNKHKHKHMVNHICWNPSFFPLPNADIHEISNFYQKRHLFIKNYSFFIKNLIDPPYKKLQPQISPFIKNSIFGNNRDPWPPGVSIRWQYGYFFCRGTNTGFWSFFKIALQRKHCQRHNGPRNWLCDLD